MNAKLRYGALALGTAAAIGLMAPAGSQAAPVSNSATAVKAGGPSDVTEVRYRGRRYYRSGRHWGHRHHWGPGAAFAGAAAGIIGLAASQAFAPRHYYYDEPYAYYGGGPYVYSSYGGAPYAYSYYGGGAPYYYAGPRYYRHHWRDPRWW